MSETEKPAQSGAKKKKKKKSPVILLILMIISLGVFGFSAYKIISQKVEDNEAEEAYEEIDKIAGMDKDDDTRETMMAEPDEEYKARYQERHQSDAHLAEDEFRAVPISIVDFEALWKKNRDVRAWIQMEDSVINYPVAQAEDNNAYLRHLLNGSYHRFGTLFFDYRNDLTGDKLNDDITIIYGHNIRAGDMFHTLQFFTSQSFYENHRYCVLYMPNGVYRIDFFAMVIIGEYDQLLFEYPENAQGFLDRLKSRSIFKSTVEVTPEDKIVGLFTCTNEDHSERYILYGRVVPLIVPDQQTTESTE
ncbi:MAG: class B sortase [Lachnospiraceae bacterium]|nr:class B sortase [Lachnospiraceae bacterium]